MFDDIEFIELIELQPYGSFPVRGIPKAANGEQPDLAVSKDQILKASNLCHQLVSSMSDADIEREIKRFAAKS